MNPVRIAVVGAGHLGRIHARLLNEQAAAELVAVVDPVESAGREVASQFGVPAYSGLDQVIERADAAVVASTTRSHFDVCRTLLEAGLHVLVEKPIAHDTQQADRLVHLATRQRRVLQVGHVERFNPAWEDAQPFLDGPQFIAAARRGPYSGRSLDTSVVEDLMIHDIDLVLSLVSAPVTSVHAVATTVFGPQPDVATAQLVFANGCLAQLDASRVEPQAERSMRVLTKSGQVQIDFARGAVTVREPSAAVRRGDLQPHLMSPEGLEQFKRDVFEVHFPQRERETRQQNAIACEQGDFIAAVQTGRPVRVPGTAGRDALLLAERILAEASQRNSLRRAG